MGLLHYLWSKTAASNATADANVNWQEGQAPSSVNDSARAMMASLAGYRDDIAGAIVTGGTSTAYTVTSNQIFDTLAHMSGQMIAFTPHATNGATVTLNVDGLGAKPLRSSPSVELAASSLILGTPYFALYNNSDAVWYLHGGVGAANAYSVPLGSGMDYWGTVAPSSIWAFPAGQAISRTTYAPLFSLFGTIYGIGDGSTTFNLPNKAGRISAMKETVADGSRLLNTTYFGDSTSTGAVGGGQSNTLATANLPAYTPSGTNSTTTVAVRSYTAVDGSNDGTHISTGNNAGADAGTFSTSAPTFTGVAQGGTSTPFRTVQPTIICNYIIRVL